MVEDTDTNTLQSLDNLVRRVDVLLEGSHSYLEGHAGPGGNRAEGVPNITPIT
jgi:hypothetical protein